MEQPIATVEELKEQFGLIGLAFAWGDEEDRLDAALQDKLLDAMDQSRIYHSGIEDLYTGTRTAAQTRILARIEKLLAAAEILRRPQVMKLTGTHEPLQMEDSDQFAALIEEYLARAGELLGNLSESVTPGTANSTGFAMPAFGTSEAVPDTTYRIDGVRGFLIG